MKQGATFLNLKEIYEQQLKSSFSNPGDLTMKKLIEFSVYSFEKYQIKTLNPNMREDYLVFDYGVYPRKKGTGNCFIINIIRHLSEYRYDYVMRYQLCTALHFYDNSLLKVGLSKIDMRRFNAIQSWVREIKRTEGYKATKLLTGDFFEINLTDGYRYNPSEIQDFNFCTFI